ncbi:MAG: hypothetical protein JWM52_38 [Candidatus Saccharibacteria bacterium]|nr:hypothetical protein [Candidatus Saccharibacteria bacterium]
MNNMAKGKNRSGLIVTIIVLGLVLAVFATILIIQNVNKPKTTDTTSVDKTSTSSTSTDKPPETTDDTTAETPSATVDPTTLSSIDVEPLSITVFYTKGAGAFEFAVKRTADRTQYVEFSAPELVDTKCTDDTGVFASIIVNPSSNMDETTIAQKTTVGSNTYALTLAGKNCASDQKLLTQYQDAFKNGFSSLKAME